MSQKIFIFWLAWDFYLEQEEPKDIKSRFGMPLVKKCVGLFFFDLGFYDLDSGVIFSFGAFMSFQSKNEEIKKIDNLVIHVQAPSGKLDSDGVLGIEAELIASEPREQIRLAHTGVPD